MASSKRSNNFSKNEERLLLEIVYKHKDIIECKKTDTIMNRKKIEIWVEVAKEFNAISGETFRDNKILKNKYDNLKKRTKQKVAEERQALMRTGGGPYIETKLDTTEQKIIDLLGVRAEGMATEFGDDAIMPQTPTIYTQTINEQLTVDGNITFTEENEQDIIEVLDCLPTSSFSNENALKNGDDSNKNNWAKYTPNMLRQPKTKVLNIGETPKHKKNIVGKVESWAASKTTFEIIKSQCLKEEHDLKMQHLKELHAKQLAILTEENEQRMAREKEKHDLEMAREKEKHDLEMLILRKKL